jgi:hypothetical protein
MIPWILQISILSLIVIILIHYLFSFFKNNLTVPKIKDLVNKPQKEYEEIYEIIKNAPINVKNEKTTSNIQISNEDNKQMKDELKNYLKQLDKKESNNNQNLDITDINSFNISSQNIGTEINMNMGEQSFENNSFSAVYSPV